MLTIEVPRDRQGLPPFLTAAISMDALAHCMET